MSTTNPIPAVYQALDQPPDVLAELGFGRDDSVSYSDRDGHVHVVRVERAGRSYAVVDHTDAGSVVIETLDTYDRRPAALALCVDWAIQARLYATGRRDSDPTPRHAREQAAGRDGDADPRGGGDGQTSLLAA